METDKDKESNHNLKVRRLEITDKGKGFIELLQQLTTCDSLSDKAFDDRFQELCSYGDDHLICVIEDEDSKKIIATGCVFIERKFIRNCGKVGHIEDVVVDSNSRGLQLGKKVVDFLTEHAESRGCYKVILDCSSENRGFYEKCGFKQKEIQMVRICSHPDECDYNMALFGKPLAKEKTFPWNDKLMWSFIAMLREYQSNYGRGQPFSWVELTAQFEETVGKKCGRETLKNKYAGMKVKWKLWKELKHGKAGFEWDPVEGRILASNEWWSKKIKENAEFRKFRKNGVPPDLEEVWDDIFGGIVSTRQHCVTPLMDPPPGFGDDGKMKVKSEFKDANDIGDNNDPQLKQNTTRELSSPDPETPTSCPPSIPPRKQKRTIEPTSNPPAGKRNTRQSVGSTLHQQNLALPLQTNQKVLPMCAPEATSAADSTEPQAKVTLVMEVIEEMLKEGLMVEGSPLWCFSITALVKDAMSTMFLAMSRNTARLAWMEWQFRKSGG